MKYLLIYSEIPEEDNNNLEKIIKAVKDKGNQELVDFCLNKINSELSLAGNITTDAD